jgi:hypothetical protein
MSQNDYVIANQTTPLFRADLNLALQALASNSSGSSAPSTTYANMMWYDTTNNILKMRSEADDAWISLGTLDQGSNTFTPFGLVEDSTDPDFTVDPTLLANRTTIKTFVDTEIAAVVTDPTTTQVLNATALSLSGEKGTEIVAWNGSATDIAINGTIAGGSLYYNVNVTALNPFSTLVQSPAFSTPTTNNGLPLTGTWRARTACPGKFQDGSSNWLFTPTIWLRIS